MILITNFFESLDKGIWDAIENGPFIHMLEKYKDFFLKNLGPNGLSKKGKRLNMIILLRTLSPLP